MILANRTLVNPVSVSVDGHYIGVAHGVRDGVILHRRKRFPGSGAAYYQQRHLIKLTFADIAEDEYAAIEAAYHDALIDYVVMSGIAGLGIDLPSPGVPPSGVTVDACYVTPAPGTRLSADTVEGWQMRGAVLLGPYLYNAELTLITGDPQVIYGN